MAAGIASRRSVALGVVGASVISESDSSAAMVLVASASIQALSSLASSVFASGVGGGAAASGAVASTGGGDRAAGAATAAATGAGGETVADPGDQTTVFAGVGEASVSCAASGAAAVTSTGGGGGGASDRAAAEVRICSRSSFKEAAASLAQRSAVEAATKAFPACATVSSAAFDTSVAIAMTSANVAAAPSNCWDMMKGKA